jgi:hypothetical protein
MITIVKIRSIKENQSHPGRKRMLTMKSAIDGVSAIWTSKPIGDVIKKVMNQH